MLGLRKHIDKTGNISFEVWSDNKLMGEIEIYRNPFHTQNSYLKLYLMDYPASIAASLFERISIETSCPLQVMLESTEKQLVGFLRAGGFKFARRCYEMEVTKDELKGDTSVDFPVRYSSKGSAEYSLCCQLLYKRYADSHKAVNPLTASLEHFCEALPELVAYQMRNGSIVHFAFIEDNEIAYVGSIELDSFTSFAVSVLEKLFLEYKTIFFECDDCDEVAMMLRGLFAVNNNAEKSFDTYILRK